MGGRLIHPGLPISAPARGRLRRPRTGSTPRPVAVPAAGRPSARLDRRAVEVLQPVAERVERAPRGDEVGARRSPRRSRRRTAGVARPWCRRGPARRARAPGRRRTTGCPRRSGPARAPRRAGGCRPAERARPTRAAASAARRRAGLVGGRGLRVQRLADAVLRRQPVARSCRTRPRTGFWSAARSAASGSAAPAIRSRPPGPRAARSAASRTRRRMTPRTDARAAAMAPAGSAWPLATALSADRRAASSPRRR